MNICRRNYKVSDKVLLRINANTIFITIVIDIVLLS